MHRLVTAAMLANAAATLQHQPLESVPRGAQVIVTASIPDASRLVTPQVLVRVRGARFHGYPLEQRESSEFAVRLPAAILRGTQFEYFIQVRLKDGSVARAGSAQAPFVVTIEGETAPRAPSAPHAGRGQA